MSEEIIRVALPELREQQQDILTAFQSALLDVDDYRASLAEAGDWDSLARGLVNLTELKSQLTVVLQAIEQDIYNLMPDKKTVIEGVGIIEKRRSNSKKWDSENLLRDIVRTKLDNGTGEIRPSDVFALLDDLRKVLPLTGSLGWRVNALKELGFDPDDYCDVTWGRPTIQIQK